jgi:putative DNA primase/helicase
MRFEDALRMAGLAPKAIVADGKIRRCGTVEKPRGDAGWYVLHPDGHGVWGDWSTGSGEPLGSWRDEHAVVDPKRLAELEREAARRRAEEKEARILAINGARRFWADASPLSRPHPYIERKALTPFGCAGLRTHDGLLLVPMLWIREGGRSLLNVQSIRLDGEKLFRKNAPVQGCCFVLERPHAAVTVLVEGLATGLAVYQSMRSARVVVAFNAGNLLPVARQLHKVGQLQGSVCFFADNDLGTFQRRGFNPGVDFAKKAAEEFGAGVAWPEGIEGTDAADYLAEIGEGAHRKLERLVLANAKFVLAQAP